MRRLVIELAVAVLSGFAGILAAPQSADATPACHTGDIIACRIAELFLTEGLNPIESLRSTTVDGLLEEMKSVDPWVRLIDRQELNRIRSGDPPSILGAGLLTFEEKDRGNVIRSPVKPTDRHLGKSCI